MPSDAELKRVQDLVEKQIAARTKELNERIEDLRGELRQAQQATELQRRELELLRPLHKDTAAALAWACAHPDFKVGGKHHRGFLGTAAPVLKRLGAKVDALAEPPAE